MADDDEIPAIGPAGGVMVDAALAKVDELHGVIDRAAERLAMVDLQILGYVGADAYLKVADDEAGDVIESAMAAIRDARRILAEADPKDLETPEGEVVGGG